MFDTSILDEALKRRQERQECERVNLLRRVTEALQAFRSKYGVQEAYIIGSLLVDYRWNQFSDVDVAVSGCSRYMLEIMKVLEEATARDVNVVDLDRCPAPEGFRRNGVKLYG